MTRTRALGEESVPIPSARRLAAATVLALAAACVILVAFVLPAEYGVDLLGTGKALGLVALADMGPERVAVQAGEYRSDSAEFVLGPYQSLEYSYRIEKGGGMVFSWQATGTIVADFHGQPDGAPVDYAESFDRQETVQRHGTFIAPFSGVHGWYWENAAMRDVTIKLTTAGFYSGPNEYFDGDVVPHPLRDARGKPLPQERGR
jgi:hypothetical protein